MLAGTSLFVLGIAAVFVVTGAVIGSAGVLVLSHADAISRVLGVLIVALGLMFAGVLPLGRRELRIHPSSKRMSWSRASSMRCAAPFPRSKF